VEPVLFFRDCVGLVAPNGLVCAGVDRAAERSAGCLEFSEGAVVIAQVAPLPDLPPGEETAVDVVWREAPPDDRVVRISGWNTGEHHVR